MSKTVLKYLLEGGIKGRYFVGNTILESNGERVMVYRVNGVNGIENTIPHIANIEVCYLNKEYGSNPKDRTRTEILGQLLEHKEATIEKITSAITGKFLDPNA